MVNKIYKEPAPFKLVWLVVVGRLCLFHPSSPEPRPDKTKTSLFTMSVEDICYSKKYSDDRFLYRHVTLPTALGAQVSLERSAQ